MATSAIGPAFLTQTAVFTAEFYASYAFAILISIIIDIGAQINIWRVRSNWTSWTKVSNKSYARSWYFNFHTNCIWWTGI